MHYLPVFLVSVRTVLYQRSMHEVRHDPVLLSADSEYFLLQRNAHPEHRELIFADEW